MEKDKPTILVIHARYWSDEMLKLRLAGIRRYAGTRGWRVKAVRDRGDVEEIRRRAAEMNPAGVMSMSYNCAVPRMFAKKPLVCFDCPESVVPVGVPYISHDAERTAHLAANELFSMNCAAYAFAHYFKPPHDRLPYWGLAREKCFVGEVSRRGGVLLSSFVPPCGCDRRRRDAALAKWMRSLPQHSGVFAANDNVAADIRRLALKYGMSIPDGIAIVGVDDERRACLKMRPTLTSVVPDWERSGYAAASALGCVMDGRRLADRLTVSRPLGIVRRETTTRRHPELDPRMDAAVAFIRSKACSGLRVPDVVAFMKSSRRYADKRFREITGSSILEEIRCVRFDCARELLSSTDIPLPEVSSRSGWHSLPTFCREFKRMAGMTPEAWRKACR